MQILYFITHMEIMGSKVDHDDYIKAETSMC